MSFYDISLLDFIVFFLLLGFSVWSLWSAFMSLENENTRLRERNALLAQWLQMAELHTGTPYYTSVAVGAVPYENIGSFMDFMQNRVKSLPIAPVFGTDDK